MAKLHFVKRARKNHRRGDEIIVLKGQSYWWLKRRHPGQVAGHKLIFTKRPKPSQVEGNPFRAAVLAVQEELEAGGFPQDAADELRALAEEQREKFNNIPEPLQQSETAQRLEEQAERLDEIADELERAAEEMEESGEEDDGLVDNISWDVE